MPCALLPRETGAVPTEKHFYIVYILWGQTMTLDLSKVLTCLHCLSLLLGKLCWLLPQKWVFHLKETWKNVNVYVHSFLSSMRNRANMLIEGNFSSLPSEHICGLKQHIQYER